MLVSVKGWVGRKIAITRTFIQSSVNDHRQQNRYSPQVIVVFKMITDRLFVLEQLIPITDTESCRQQN